MKKSILTAIVFVGMALCARAQEGPGFFIGAGAGMNFGFDGFQFVDRANSHNGAGYAGDFYLGGWLSDYFGLRAGYQGFGISDSFTDFGKYGYHYGHGDVMFRLGQYFVPYVHAGYAHIVNGGFAGGAGLIVPVRMGKRVSLIPDLKVNVFDSKLYGAVAGNVAANLSATIGIAVRLGKVRERPRPGNTVIYDTRIVHDTIVVPEVVTKVIRDTVYVTSEQVEDRHRESFGSLSSEGGIVLFDTNKYDLRPESISELDRLIGWLIQHPEARVFIEGHTDSTSTPVYNQELSENRAWTVYEYMLRNGVSPAKVKWEGFGPTRPVADNDTPEGRQLNRRVEIKVEQ